MATTHDTPSTAPQPGSLAGIPPLELSKTMTGMEFLRALISGAIPPPAMATTLGFTIDAVEEGYARFSMTPGAQHFNPLGTVHGGVATTLLDSCMGCAVHTRLDRGIVYLTLELKVNLVRAMTDETGPIIAEGRTLHFGRRSATAEGKMLDAKGNLIAHGTTTCLLYPL